MWAWRVLVGLTLLGAGCKSAASSPTDGGGRDSAVLAGTAGDGALGEAGTNGSAGAAGGAAGTGGAAGGAAGTAGGGGAAQAGGATGTATRDCLPACVVALRRECERPNVDAGSCIQETGPNGAEKLCFSNGVVEQRYPTGDGGLTQDVDFFKADGSFCYRVRADVQAETLSYLDGDGKVVAVLNENAPGGGAWTCDGLPAMPASTDPSCRMLDVGDCAFGSCP